MAKNSKTSRDPSPILTKTLDRLTLSDLMSVGIVGIDDDKGDPGNEQPLAVRLNDADLKKLARMLVVQMAASATKKAAAKKSATKTASAKKAPANKDAPVEKAAAKQLPKK